MEHAVASWETDQKLQTFGKIQIDIFRWIASSAHVIFWVGQSCVPEHTPVLHVAHISNHIYRINSKQLLEIRIFRGAIG